MRPLRRVATAVTKPQAVEPLSRVIDYPLLISWGYDPVTGIFAPDPDHPLLGWQVCRVGGCGREAVAPGGAVLGLPGPPRRRRWRRRAVQRPRGGPEEPVAGPSLPGLPGPGVRTPRGNK